MLTVKLDYNALFSSKWACENSGVHNTQGYCFASSQITFHLLERSVWSLNTHTYLSIV